MHLTECLLYICICVCVCICICILHDPFLSKCTHIYTYVYILYNGITWNIERTSDVQTTIIPHVDVMNDGRDSNWQRFLAADISIDNVSLILIVTQGSPIDNVSLILIANGNDHN